MIDFHCTKLTNSQVSSPYTGNEGNNRIKLTESLAQKFCHFLAQFIHPSEIILPHLSYAPLTTYLCSPYVDHHPAQGYPRTVCLSVGILRGPRESPPTSSPTAQTYWEQLLEETMQHSQFKCLSFDKLQKHT